MDECGTHTSLGPIYGYAPKGERLQLSVPRKRGKNTTLLASMSIEGMGPCLAVEGSTTKALFEAYVERGAKLLYLPSYSPDHNPIEEAFAKVKNLLGKAAARTKGALVEAIGVALSALSVQDARGYFEHAGYRSPAHLL